MLDMSESFRDREKTYSVKTVTKTKDNDLNVIETAIERNQLLAIQTVSMNKINVNILDWSISHIAINSRFEIKNNEYIYYNGKVYILKETKDNHIEYNYYKARGEEFKDVVPEVTP